jgi:hypothetical protein
LDFKNGLDFYPGPFFFIGREWPQRAAPIAIGVAKNVKVEII